MIADKLTRISQRITSVNEKTDQLNAKLGDIIAQFDEITETFIWYDNAITIACFDGRIEVGIPGDTYTRPLLSASRTLRIAFAENLERFLDAFEQYLDAEMHLFT